MTDPKENEEINEELSTDELKSVSGGVISKPDSRYNVGIDADGDGLVCLPSCAKKEKASPLKPPP